MANGALVAHNTLPSGGNYRLVAAEVLKEALSRARLPASSIKYTVATGYGAASVAAAGDTGHEITCGARAVSCLFPSVRTVVDLGAQFSRVFRVDGEGRAAAFVLSEKCAGGSGRFLQVMARMLQIDLSEIGPLSLASRQRIDFATGCAVFAESETVSRIAEGARKEDILAAVHRAISAKVANLVERVGPEPDFALIGGGARDIGLVKSLEEKLGAGLIVPDEPQIMAALGAALLAGEKAGAVSGLP